MELNYKTKVMCFGPDQIELNILMNGKLLEQVHMYKFLGVLVDENVDFEMHTGVGTTFCTRSTFRTFFFKSP